MRKALRIAAAVAILSTLCLLGQSQPTYAQLLTARGDYFVTELQPDKHEIGVSLDPNGTTRTWVKVEDKTRVSERMATPNGERIRHIPHDMVWSELRPGMRIHVNGGRDWEDHIVAKRLQYWATAP